MWNTLHLHTNCPATKYPRGEALCPYCDKSKTARKGNGLLKYSVIYFLAGSHKNAQLTCKLTAQKKAPNSLFSSDIFVIKLESDFFVAEVAFNG